MYCPCLNEIKTEKVSSIGQLIDFIGTIKKKNNENCLYFRGENNDFGASAFQPSIYRKYSVLNQENVLYREMQRFNEHEFHTDRTAIDKLARMQHYNSPTRLIDISEDILSATYFALENKGSDNCGVVYIVEIDEKKIKYYDSDAVSVIANLAKLPLVSNVNQKSKKEVGRSAYKFLNDLKKFNEEDSVKFLLHEIKEEKSYFESIIDPEHIFSIQCVRPKYNNLRLHTQKGAFLLFGLNKHDAERSIDFIHEIDEKLFINNTDNHPIVKIHKVILDNKIELKDVEKLGVTLPYIYPEIDRVGNYLKQK